MRSADFKLSGRIDKIFDIVIQQFFGDNLVNHLFDKLSKLFNFHLRGMLMRDDNGLDILRFAAPVADGHLAFCIRAEVAVLMWFSLSQPGQLFDNAVGIQDWSGHQFRCFVGGEAEHHSLVTGALFQIETGSCGYPLGDIR